MDIQSLIKECNKNSIQQNGGSSGIYIINYDIGKKIYIGSTVNFNNRWKSHQGSFKRKNHHSPYLQHIVNKHGIEVLEFHILEITDSKDEDFLIERENFYLLQLDREILLNDMIPARKGAPGWKGTEKQKAFISKLGKDSKYRIGRVVSDKTKKKHSEDAKKQDLSYLRTPEIIAKRAEKLKGPRPDSYGANNKNTKTDLETCQKIKQEYDLIKATSKNKTEKGLTKILSIKYNAPFPTTKNICYGQHWSNPNYVRPNQVTVM